MYAMYNRFFRTGVLRVLLGVVLLSWSLGPTTPTWAEQPLDPAQRVHFSLYDVTVFNDRDSGKGEVSVELRIWRVNEGCPADATDKSCITQLLRDRSNEASVNDGDTYLINVQYPSPPGVNKEQAEELSSLYGIPL